MKRGTVIMVTLPDQGGHEQAGGRPCVVVNGTTMQAWMRYPLVHVVPISASFHAKSYLYPSLSPSRMSGLTRDSTALVDQIRAIDKKRISGAAGVVTEAELASIDVAIRVLFGL